MFVLGLGCSRVHASLVQFVRDERPDERISMYGCQEKWRGNLMNSMIMMFVNIVRLIGLMVDNRILPGFALQGIPILPFL